MLRSLDDLKHYAIHASDGDIGHVKDFYFDDEGWAIRYFVVDTGGWLLGRKVLITPISVIKSDWSNKALSVGITAEQVKNSPDINTDKPVSRQHEYEYLGYYGYPMYWGGAGLWGEGIYPDMMMPGYPGYPHSYAGGINHALSEADERREIDDSHLRSCQEVTGYNIVATDGEIGHVSGMLLDDETWAIRYLIVDTSNWWLGSKVLIVPLWIDQIEWPGKQVTVNLTRQAIKDAVVYDVGMTFDREKEIAIHRHYDRVGYWEREEKNEKMDTRD